MATFRDSKSHNLEKSADAAVDASRAARRPVAAGASAEDAEVYDKTIGDILAGLRNLSVEQVDKALAYQRSNNVRFGEAAVALGYVTRADVLFALSQQFHYPYAFEERRDLSPELVALNEPFSPRAEGFRALRSQLLTRLSLDADRRHAVAVISPDAGDGKTYCAANLAVTLAQLGGRTLLVDADMRGPRVHELFKLDNSAGLSGILAGRSDKKVLRQVTCVPSLFVLPVGTTPPNPLELLERPAFGLLVRELVSKFDHVVVDTPAACFGSDSAVIASRCGAAVLVARRNKGKVAALQRMVADVSGTPHTIIGAVVNEY